MIEVLKKGIGERYKIENYFKLLMCVCVPVRMCVCVLKFN